MKTIIVSTDFSPEADNAAAYAGGLAKALNAKVILFNSYSLPVHAANARLSAESIHYLEENNRILLKERASTLSHAYGVEVSSESALLLPVTDGLDGLMAKYDADLVVMGMAPRSLAQDVFGNTTTSVIMKLKFSVLAVPVDVRFEGIKRILFACENPEEVPDQISEKIKVLASLLDAVVEIFYVDDKVKQIGMHTENRLDSSIATTGFEGVVHYYKDVKSDAVIKEIENEVRDNKADLLIMSPKRYGFWESLIHRSKTRMMASNNHIPLLSIPV